MKQIRYRGKIYVEATNHTAVAAKKKDQKWSWFLDISGESDSFEEACLAMEESCPNLKGDIKRFLNKNPGDTDVSYDFGTGDVWYNMRIAVDED